MQEPKKKHNYIIFLYGILVLSYAIFSIFVEIVPEKHLNSINPIIKLIEDVFYLTCISIYVFPVNLIIAYGLFRKRYWARQGVILVILTFPIYILSQIMWWGLQSAQFPTLIIQISFLILTLLYFTRKKVKLLFSEAPRFKLVSWRTLFGGFIVLNVSIVLLISLLFKIYFIWKFDEPIFVEKPQVISLEKQTDKNLIHKYRRVELINIALLIPKEFGVGNLSREEIASDNWRIELVNTNAEKNGFISIGNSFILDEDILLNKLRKRIKLNTRFDFEKFMLTNNWNPIFLILRSIARLSEEMKVKEVYFNDIKGFLKIWKDENYVITEFSLNSSDDKRYGGGSFILDKELFDENDIQVMIASFEFLDPIKTDSAKSHYKKGLDFYKKGDLIQAQFEMANAYYKSPENPEYIYLLAKMLPQDSPNDYSNIKELLDLALEINPAHKDAQKYLKEITPKLLEENEPLKENE